MRICSVNYIVNDLFSTLNVGSIIPLFPSRQEALEAGKLPMHKDSCAKHRVHIKTIGCRTNQEEMTALGCVCPERGIFWWIAPRRRMY
jgi:hypothetical protein